MLSVWTQPFLGLTSLPVKQATSLRLPGVGCTSRLSCSQKLPNMLVFFFHSPPNQSEGLARRGGGEWSGGSSGSASGAPRASCLCASGRGQRAQGKGSEESWAGAAPCPEPQRPGRVPSPPLAPGQVSSGPLALARALRCSSEQLHNEAWVRGCGAAFVIAICLAAAALEY